jgi:hypothetical protein
MNKNLIKTLYYPLFSIFITSCSVLGIRSGYETLEYKVLEIADDIEIREYPARLVAEVTNIKNDNEAFMLLFNYISGENISSQDISMTTPVQVSKESAKIDMTTPVEVTKSKDAGVSMRFFLPRSYKIENVPKPMDSRININEIPSETFAVITYSGFNSEKNFKSNSDILLNTLAKTNWQVVSKPTFLGYDPPFTLPFLRKNEVIVKVGLKK